MIPPALLEDLYLTTDQTPDDKLRFTPEGWVRYPNHAGQTHTGHGYAFGSVFLPEWECEVEAMVHNVHEDNSEKICKDAWTVIPYATTADTLSAPPGFAIMARVCKYEWVEPETSQGVTYDEEPEEDSLEPASLPGPFGRLYSGQEWASMVRHGCSFCSADLNPEDAEEIEWVGEMEAMPLCVECTVDLNHYSANEEEE